MMSFRLVFKEVVMPELILFALVVLVIVGLSR